MLVIERMLPRDRKTVLKDKEILYIEYCADTGEVKHSRQFNETPRPLGNTGSESIRSADPKTRRVRAGKLCIIFNFYPAHAILDDVATPASPATRYCVVERR